MLLRPALEELMSATRTPGIVVLADGRRFIDKRHLGVRIGLRVGAVTQEQAEERLRTEMARVESGLARKTNARPTFTDCAARYIEQSRGKRSIDVTKWHAALLESHVGSLEPRQVLRAARKRDWGRLATRGDSR
jgi:hypothetical protein